MVSQTAGAADLFLPGKEVRVSNITRQIRKLLGKQKLLGKFVNTFHVKEEKIDEEINDTYCSSSAGML